MCFFPQSHCYQQLPAVLSIALHQELPVRSHGLEELLASLAANAWGKNDEKKSSERRTFSHFHLFLVQKWSFLLGNPAKLGGHVFFCFSMSLFFLSF